MVITKKIKYPNWGSHSGAVSDLVYCSTQLSIRHPTQYAL